MKMTLNFVILVIFGVYLECTKLELISILLESVSRLE